MTNSIHQRTLTRSHYKSYLEKGIDYHQYKIQMAEDLAVNEDMKTREYINLNQRRMYRVEKTYVPSADILKQLKELKHKAYWLVLTEH